jgi:hypothetical protein
MSEIRTHSYFNKTSILHIDRRKEFKKKLINKSKPKNETANKQYFSYDEKF